VSPQAKHLLLRLLDRNPDTRLTDPEKIKTHPWFSAFDWGMLYRKEIPPPYIPLLTSTHSTEMFDPDFTRKNVEVEIGTQDQTIDDTNDDMFKEYTYVEAENQGQSESWPGVGGYGKLVEVAMPAGAAPSRSQPGSYSNISV